MTAMLRHARPAYRHFVHGLEVVSDVHLEELPSDIAQSHLLDRRPVIIQHAHVPQTIEHRAVSKEGYLVADGAIHIAIPDLGRFLISDARQVTVHPDHGASNSAVRLFLVSACLACLLHQRRRLPLHCAAIETPAGCVAFVGNAGDGKSTLAASLASRGFTPFTDDRLALYYNGHDVPVAAPSVPVLHLHRDAIGLVKLSHAARSRHSYRFSKQLYLLPEHYAHRPAPLVALYFTDWCDDMQAPVSITPLAPIHAVMRLRRDVSLAHLVQLLGHEQLFLEQCGKLCARVPAFHLLRPRNTDFHERSIDLIVQHLEQTLGTS